MTTEAPPDPERRSAYGQTLDSLELLPDYVLHSAVVTLRRHPAARWLWSLLRLNFTGIAISALFVCWSLTPSLLPRGWFYQGVVSGVTAAVGYWVGVFVAFVVDRLYLQQQSWWPLRWRSRFWLRSAVVAAALISVTVMLVVSARWQDQLAALMDAQGSSSPSILRTGILTLLIATLLIAVARMLRDLVRVIARLIRRWIRLPKPLANLLGLVLVVFLAGGFVQGVLLDGTLAVTNSVFSTQNGTTRSGVTPPTVPERTGGPGSNVSWDTLGFEGRNFVTGGLSQEEMTRATGRESKEAIRVYVGLKSAPTPEERAALLVRELERTGAFTRKAIVVIPTTGTGWVNPTAARAVELMYDGDVALVASQYSYLPSWISFVFNREKAGAAGRTLIDTVRARWQLESPASRPKLYIYGESLGTQAGEGAFADIADIRSKVDGVLWVGPPNSNRIWDTYVSRRDPGSTQVEPVYANGLLVRFAANGSDVAADAAAPPDQWQFPRVLYVAHPSDPVVWWNPSLITRRPDWLSEPPGNDRLPSMRWFPFVTFWQVSADLGNAAGVPDGHGHNYGTTVLDGFAAVAAPPGWTAGDTERVRKVMIEYADSDGPEK